MADPLVVIALGWGAQSFTMAAMSALGELPPVDYAIHADTGHEAEGTYRHAREWTRWLEDRGVKVVTVSGTRRDVVLDSGSPSVLIPAFSVMAGKNGQTRRQCTREWKIRPMRRWIRSKLDRLPPGAVESWQGISWDEADRMGSSDVAYITNRFPLCEQRITRAGCIAWLQAKGLAVPRKSACTFCPYHDQAAWHAIKNENGFDWREALAVDGAIRDKRQPRGELFVHPGRRPLEAALHDPEVGQSPTPCDSGFCFR